MKKVTVHKDYEINKKIYVSCRVCKRENNHTILTDIQSVIYEKIDEYEEYESEIKYQIVQCLGCENIMFRQSSKHSEDYFTDDEGNYVEVDHIDIYPNPDVGRLPISDSHLLPRKLNQIYKETLNSLNANLPIVCGIGIRAIVETICKDKSAKGDDLNKKINDLVTQGVLTKDGADILHKLRTLGNEAAHEVKPHQTSHLSLALDVIDHLLQGVYILPHHASYTFT